MGFIGLGMKNFVSAFIWTCLFASTQLFGVVIHAPNLDVIEKCISDLDENALVVFDVDYTLLVPMDCILAPAGEEHFQKFMKKLRDLQEEGEILGSRISLQAQVTLVDKKILSLLKSLKQRHVKVIALTAMPTGRLGDVSNAEEWRVRQLASLGIYLDCSFPKIDSLVLEDFQGKKTQPVFKQGVLASAKYPKGQVLCAFLKKIRWKPSKVIFVDDRMEYIDSVECELDKENINHTSFHYTAATDKSCQLDQKLADFQFEYLLQQGIWLSDEEAANKMNMLDGNPSKINELMRKNQQKFAAVKKLDLPIGQYAITGSGALGIRNLREIGDIDIIVTTGLWNAIAARYGITDENGVKKVVFPDGIVEALGECSFYTEKKENNAPTITDRITHAEIIEGLPFESLDHVLYYKQKMGREKDKRDILLIQKLLDSIRTSTPDSCKAEGIDEDKSVVPLSSIVLKEVIDILSKRFDRQIHVGSIIQLSEQERRNLIVRISIQNPSLDIPKSIILKKTLSSNLSDDSNKIWGRFARDWAGLEFLSTLKTGAPPIPKFYGGSLEHGFILIEDLGETHVSLVDSLTGDNAKEAEIALLRFMTDLGKLHAGSYGKTEEYLNILKKVNPSAESWQDNLQKTLEKDLPALKLSLENLNIVLTEDVLSEVSKVFKSNLAPGPFTTLIHGDICPDNVFYNREKNELYLIDFEWSFVKNALLDGTYLRMSFPTCWCAKALPSNLISTFEASYREQLKRTIPASRIDEEYNEAYVNACAFWMLKSLLMIQDVLEKEDIWPSGTTSSQSLWKPEANQVRPRILSRLTSFIEVSKGYKKLPYLLSMAKKILKELEIRWPDAKPLELYPAFSKFSTDQRSLTWRVQETNEIRNL